MNDEEHMRDLIAMFAMNGMVSTIVNEPLANKIAVNAYLIADAMMQARSPKEEGIVSIKKRTKQ